MDQDIAVDAAQSLGERNLEPVEIFRDGQTIFSLQGNGHESAFRAADVITDNVGPRILRNPPDVALGESTGWTVRVNRFHAVCPRTMIGPRALARISIPRSEGLIRMSCFEEHESQTAKTKAPSRQRVIAWSRAACLLHILHWMTPRSASACACLAQVSRKERSFIAHCHFQTRKRTRPVVLPPFLHSRSGTFWPAPFAS